VAAGCVTLGEGDGLEFEDLDPLSELEKYHKSASIAAAQMTANTKMIAIILEIADLEDRIVELAPHKPSFQFNI
jgi:hypothetical protein